MEIYFPRRFLLFESVAVYWMVGQVMEQRDCVISVCIITYKRPNGLSDLLESLVIQTLMELRNVEIVVVDNDSKRSAESIIKEFITRNPDIAVTYEVEPVQGIPQARNRSVKLAKGKFIAFIDDDETADPAWLEVLFECMKKYGADAVFGPVTPILPPDCARWLRKGRFFDRPHHEDGSVIGVGRTNNANGRP